jgi:hypothetical protein
MSKKNITLLIILVVLAGLAYFYQGPYQKIKEDMAKPKNFFAKIDTGKLDKVEIRKVFATTTLEKVDERWKVGETKDFYVNKAMLDSLLKVLTDAKSGELELASTNKDKKADFNTDDLQGTMVNLYENGKNTLTFIIGKIGPDYTTTYISKPGDNNTYKINVILASGFEQQDFRDSTVFTSEKDKITKIRFQYPNREFTVEKKNGKWEGTIPYKFPVNQDKLGKVADIMSGLVSSGIPEQNFKGTDLEKNSMIIEATGEGINNTLMVGKNNGKDEFYAKKGSSDNIYLITNAQKADLDKKIETLK